MVGRSKRMQKEVGGCRRRQEEIVGGKRVYRRRQEEVGVPRSQCPKFPRTKISVTFKNELDSIEGPSCFHPILTLKVLHAKSLIVKYPKGNLICIIINSYQRSSQNMPGLTPKQLHLVYLLNDQRRPKIRSSMKSKAPRLPLKPRQFDIN